MKVIDAHCDALNRMMLRPDIDFHSSEHLDVTLERLVASGSAMQLFAVYLSATLHSPGFREVLQCIDYFYTKVLAHPQMRHIRYAGELAQAEAEGKIGAMLTLEGVDGLMGDELYLRTVFQLGVRCIGLTWNYANWAADGVKEPRQGGLTLKGRQFVKQCEELGIILDVSHLTERGFWELAELSPRPFIASHSNALDIAPDPRNLSRAQIEAIRDRDGRIGLTFIPWLVDTTRPAVMTDLLRHIDYVASLGGGHILGFGSDFDGLSRKTEGLEHAGCFPALAELLARHYDDDFVRGLLYENWRTFFERSLPVSVI
ncbi:membrane dipeptidase [Paenibacillus filicis]|uniref:Membrane dipeptidase n=1 Tax=Paenibacillus filicis TaxID=669464 RepID=A0ABU9DJP8_9BACL